MSSDLKQVKVDNWGIYFLQRLKHFFNRTDYCDLTLQFQDNAQLKVHRLVLNVCTEYFELLERTCEMYEDCLVMPDDLQADVVVPIVNFMYTGQLEFKMDSLEKLYQTSLVMNMPVLTKLLETHRNMRSKQPPPHHYFGTKNNAKDTRPQKYSTSSSSNSNKRVYSKAFESNKLPLKPKVTEFTKSMESSRNNQPSASKVRKYYSKDGINNGHSVRSSSPVPTDTDINSKKMLLREPRPTRYEVPEELVTDNIFSSSFSNISYDSKPLIVHPEAPRKYLPKRNMLASGSKKIIKGPSTMDIVECKKITKMDNTFDHHDDTVNVTNDEMFQPAHLSIRQDSNQSQLFDQMAEIGSIPKVTIEGKDKHSGNLDHAKIISEVLKKYPHLMKSNKNIKLKILDTPQKLKKVQAPIDEKFEMKPKTEMCYTFETDVLDSKEAAKLITMGAENVKGPWICLICGTPGRALNFTSYYNYRRHLVEVHNEKPVANICEYCGLKSFKRNYLLHHMQTKHGVAPPPQYQFPKCNMCDYVALTDTFLAKHKLTHSDSKTAYHCGVCGGIFKTSSKWLFHIQNTGHKQNSNKRLNLSCTYCSKIFQRESNFIVHLKTCHKDAARRDGVITDSDEEAQYEESNKTSHNIIKNIKFEHPSFDNQYEDTDIQFEIHERSGNIQINKKQQSNVPITKHKILNLGFNSSVKPTPKQKRIPKPNTEFIQEFDTSDEINDDNIVYIDGNDLIVSENQLIPNKSVPQPSDEFVIPDTGYMETDLKSKQLATPTTSVEFSNSETTIQPTKMAMKKSINLNEPIQIVVSNEEEYKALMSTDNSIIFDNNDPSKTLTVLTAPQTIDSSTINLESAQSTDMMIIQEDFPLSVSETVSGDQKYVVVYSHSVTQGDTNKEYQIITPQEIGAQYIQASEVITQGYETVTTTASAINSHIIEAQIEGSWPDQIQDSQALKNDSQNPIENITIEQNIELNDTNIELPKVQITSDISLNNMSIEQSTSNLGNPDTVRKEESIANLGVLKNVQGDISDTVNIHMPLQSKLDKDVISGSNNIIVEMSDQIQNVDKVTLDSNMPVLQQQDNQQNSISISQNCEPILSKKVSTSNNIESASSEMTAEVVPASENIVSSKQNAPQENVTSDLSEDELDSIIEQGSNSNRLSTELEQTSEVEESIENIQHEMQMQMTNKDTIVEEQSITSDEAIVGDKNELRQYHKNDTTSRNVEATKEKITLLLNDWEDNESPELKSVADNKSEEAQQSDSAREVQTSNEGNSQQNVNQNKNDNIKSLVSDWDEEEEVKE